MNENLVKVKRDGPRGWHLIDRAKFEAGGHELYSDAPAEPVLTDEQKAAAEAEQKAKAEAAAAEAARIARESGKKGK